MFGGRNRREICDAPTVRTHALSRVGVESSRARVPCMAGCQFAPATALRERAGTAYWKRFLDAYGSQRRESKHRIVRSERNLRYRPMMNAPTSNCRPQSRPCQNKSFLGSGSYREILVRDQQMDVVPTPFALAEGTAHRCTLILPAGMQVDDDLVEIGCIVRRQVDRLVVAYNFDMRSNELTATFAPNPTTGTERAFKAYRLEGDPFGPVVLHDRSGQFADRESRNLVTLALPEE